jgi:putative protease
MLQLLSPAGSTEAVIAAVQSGADIVHMGFGASEVGENQGGFSAAELAQCLRYCRVRGCQAVVSVNELTSDDTIVKAVDRAVYAAQQGANALMVQDIGLIAVLRSLLPDTPLWGGVRLNIHNRDGALAAAALGLSRVMLAPELTFEQIQTIAHDLPIETGVCVHGPLCFSYMGQCYMSALGEDRQSDSCLHCAEPCRKHFSLGGRMDDYPMSMADVYLMEHLQELEQAGVTCAVLGGRSRCPEYVAFLTNLYAQAIRDKTLPTQEEKQELLGLFATNGLTDGYFTGEKGPAMFGTPKTPDRSMERAYGDIRKGYMESERRRVPITFYVVMQQGQPARFAAEDDRGHRAVYEGYIPMDLGRQGITKARVQELLYRTGGTPYNCVGIQCRIDPHLDYADEALEQARRALLAQITEQSRPAQPVTVGQAPDKPLSAPTPTALKRILQVSRLDQLSPELAETKPDYLYVPAELLAAGADVEPFRTQGTQIVAVLPRIVSDSEMPVIRELLETMRLLGIDQVLVGSLGLIPAVRAFGMTMRGDFGLNLTNSWALERMSQAGFASLTASFQLSSQSIRTLSKPVDMEMLIYGRVPVMVTEHCLIHNSTGRCSCATPTAMSDPFGSVYPVVKEFGCRNTVYDGKKIFLADRPEAYEGLGLWAARLLFTTESAKECVDVARRYQGENRYKPNNTSRGSYPKGVL